MNTIAGNFKRWRAATSIPTHASWNIPCDLSSMGVVDVFLHLIDEEQFAAKGSVPNSEAFEILCQVSDAICDDICDISDRLELTQITEQTACLVGCITAGTRVAGIAIDNGDLRSTYSWLVRCLLSRDDVEILRPMLPSLLTDPGQLFPSNLLTHRIARFAEVLYIYDQFTNGLDGVTSYWFESLQAWLLVRLPFRPELSNLALILMRWADLRDEDDSRLRDYIRMLADTNALDKEVAPRAAVFFARRAHRRGEADAVDLTNHALRRFRGGLTGTELIELVGIQAASSSSLAVMTANRILHAIDMCMRDWYSTTPDELILADRRGSHFKLIGRILDSFIEGQRADLATLALGAWLMVPPEERRSDILIWHLSHDPGVGWATGHCVSIGPSPVDLTELAAAEGILTGRRFSILDAPDYESPPIERPGVPNVAGGSAVETLFKDLVAEEHLNRVCVCWQEAPPHAIIPLVNIGVPPQPLMISNVGWSLPWSVTLRSPFPDRLVRNVRIILTGTESGLVEISGVEACFRNSDIEVDVHASTDLGARDFLKLYSDPNPDIVWVVGHGEFDFGDPKQIRLPLPDGSSILATQLRHRLPVRNSRRLLVLNLCDAATSISWGSLPEFGLGALAVSPSQAVIGHGWPILAWPDAALFGRLLASSLVSHRSFYAAYEQAMRVLLAGSDIIAKQLDGQGGDLDERLLTAINGRHGERLKEYVTWGSAAFLE